MSLDTWYTLPSGVYATDCDTGLLVQRTTMAGRLTQAVLLTWEDIARLDVLRISHATHGMPMRTDTAPGQQPWPEVIGI